MSTDKLIYQCTQCGKTQVLKEQRLIDDIYADVFCPHCKKQTMHLECGQDILDFYKYYDPVVDERFYNYQKTKQND